jgi:hypothetical protein
LKPVNQRAESLVEPTRIMPTKNHCPRLPTSYISVEDLGLEEVS